MRHNGERRPEEIQAEIARTRGDMDATLTAIEQRLTPGQLIDQGLDYVRSSGANEFVSNLGGSVKSNPIPVALMGIGMAWLMATGNRKPAYLREGGSVEGAAPGMMQRASEGLSSTKDRLSQTAQSAKAHVGQIGQGARERMSYQAERVRTGYDSLVREQPLVLGAIGLAVGALLAAAAPRTRREDELMGEASDRLTERAREAGKQTLEKAKQVATAAKDSAAQQKPAGRPAVVEPARATPVTESAKPKDPRLGTP